MAEVELAKDVLIVQVRGMDQLWALRGVPGDRALSRILGAHKPLRRTAGTFYQEGERVFWDVHETRRRRW
jgi:hypothetical protein